MDGERNEQRPDREPGGFDVATPGDTTHSSKVQQAVEKFVELHSCGEAPELTEFVQDYPQNTHAEILSQCREFLSFDGLLGHQEWQPQAEPETDGRTFGDFLIKEELGRGGMGVVYLAQQRSLNRRVALKVMASGLTLSKRHVERFRREAAATAKLRHPAIVSVHSLTEVDGTFALAMDYVAGRNLADILDDLRLQNGKDPGEISGPLGIAPEKGYVAECVMLAAQVASALATAHQNQVVHRDLKPRNLMLDDRRQARLLDFGLAKSLDTTRESLSMSGEITGTAHYMSPEQTLAKRVEVDHRADIWSLGVILYELLTLHRPFDGKNLQQIVYEICFKEPMALQKRNPKVPRDLVTIVNKALEKDPQNRYQSAAEFEADLQRFLNWEPVHAKPASTWTRMSKFLRRHRTETAIGATALLVTTILLSAYWYRTSANHERADNLLQQAQERADDGQFKQAIALANDALELRNDEATRARLELYYTADKLNWADAAWKVAESKRLLEHDRTEALRLALDAEQQASSSQTRSAVLDALGSGSTMRTLATPGARRVLVANWAPNGKHILTAGFAGSLAFFHSDTQREPTSLLGHNRTAPVAGAVFVGNDRIVSASVDKTLRFWNPNSDEEPTVIELAGHAAAFYSSKNGERVMVVTNDGAAGTAFASVWDTSTQELIGKPVQHGNYIVAANLSPDGRYAATSGGDRAVRLWRVDDGSTIAELKPDAEFRGARIMQFSNNGELLAIGTSTGLLRIYESATGELLGSGHHPRQINCMAFDSDDARLLSGSLDKTARLWKLQREADGKIALSELAVLQDHDGEVRCVAFDASDRLAVTGTSAMDGKLRVFDVGTVDTPNSERIHRYEVGAQIDRAEFAPDGHRVLATAGGRALVWNFGSGRGVVTLRQDGSVPAASFANEGRRLVTAGDDERLRLWQTRDGRQVWVTPKLGNPVVGVDVDGKSERVACGLTNGKVFVHRLRDGEQLYELRGHQGKVPVVRFLGDGSRLLTAGTQKEKRNPKDKRKKPQPERGRAIVWSTNDQSPLVQLDSDKPIVCADVTDDGKLLVTAEEGDHFVRLWRLDEDGKQWSEDRLLGDEDEGARVRHVRISPDGEHVLIARAERTARLYSIAGEFVTTFATNSLVRVATFSPDGKLILTCGTGRNGGAQLWRTADGEEVLHFEGHRGTVEWGTFSSTGEWIATCSRDHTTHIWPTDPVAAARRLPLPQRSTQRSANKPR